MFPHSWRYIIYLWQFAQQFPNPLSYSMQNWEYIYSIFYFNLNTTAIVFDDINSHGVDLVMHYIRIHDDVIKWKHSPRNWPFVREIHRSLMNSTHKGKWRRSLMFSLIRAWINGWVNNRETGDVRRHCAYYDVTVMWGWEKRGEIYDRHVIFLRTC